MEQWAKSIKGYLAGGKFFELPEEAIKYAKRQARKEEFVAVAPVDVKITGNEVVVFAGADIKKAIKQMHMKKLGKVM